METHVRELCFFEAVYVCLNYYYKRGTFATGSDTGYLNPENDNAFT